MRVVAGELRGRLFEAPPGVDTRPTTDKVREAVFNALGSLDLVRDAVVADLFAGSGGMGIEALSRGAAEVVFVERDRSALRTLRDNLRALDHRCDSSWSRTGKVWFRCQVVNKDNWLIDIDCRDIQPVQELVICE